METERSSRRATSLSASFMGRGAWTVIGASRFSLRMAHRIKTRADLVEADAVTLTRTKGGGDWVSEGIDFRFQPREVGMRSILFALLLAGCATTEKGWDKPGSTQQDFIMDRGDCVSRAFVAPTTFQQTMILTGCMQSKGWTWTEREVAAQPLQAPKERYRVCHDEAHNTTGEINSLASSYKAVYERCMARN